MQAALAIEVGRFEWRHIRRSSACAHKFSMSQLECFIGSAPSSHDAPLFDEVGQIPWLEANQLANLHVWQPTAHEPLDASARAAEELGSLLLVSQVRSFCRCVAHHGRSVRQDMCGSPR
jgi:hypothetical protein